MQAPDYTQGLNRYSYCLNNPLSLVDPSGYSWLSRNWKSLVSAIVGVAVTIISGGSASSVGAIMISGALGGASAGLTGALLNGANLGQIVKSTLTGGLWGSVGGFLANASGGGHFLEKLFKHAFSQTWLEGIRGGNMKHGLMAGITSAIGGSAIEKYGSGLSVAGKVSANAVLSGTVAEVGGGKFANGAITGAFAMMFNQLKHLHAKQQQILQRKLMIAANEQRQRWLYLKENADQLLSQRFTPSIDFNIEGAEYSRDYIGEETRYLIEMDIILGGNTYTNVLVEYAPAGIFERNKVNNVHVSNLLTKCKPPYGRSGYPVYFRNSKDYSVLTIYLNSIEDSHRVDNFIMGN